MEFLLSYRVTVPYSSVAGVYRLRCWFMDNRGVCETRLLGRQQCASVSQTEALKEITQCPFVTLISHSITFEFDNHKESLNDFLHLLLFNWLSFTVMTYASGR